MHVSCISIAYVTAFFDWMDVPCSFSSYSVAQLQSGFARLVGYVCRFQRGSLSFNTNRFIFFFTVHKNCTHSAVSYCPSGLLLISLCIYTCHIHAEDFF